MSVSTVRSAATASARSAQIPPARPHRSASTGGTHAATPTPAAASASAPQRVDRKA